MSSKSIYQSLKKAFPQGNVSKPNQELAWKVSMALTNFGVKPFQTNHPLLSHLNHLVTNLVLSDPTVPVHRRLDFFKLLASHHRLALKPDLRAHLTLARVLFDARRFAQMVVVVNGVVVDDDLRCPVSDMVDLIHGDNGNVNGNGNPEFVSKFCNILFRTLARNGMFEEALRVFDLTEKRGIPVEDISCDEVLAALKKSKMFNLFMGLFDRMVERRFGITVYMLSMAVYCLCQNGGTGRAKALIDDLSRRGIVKPNVFTYNTLLKSYVDGKDFGSVNEVLRSMEKDNVNFNEVTFMLLIEWHGSCGKFDEALKLFHEMCERGIKPDAYIYTSMIKWCCKCKDFKMAFKLFDEMSASRVSPNEHTYGALINGLCKAGQMEAAEILVKEMDSPNGIGSNRLVFNMLMDGYCRRGLIDKAMQLKGEMEKKGLEMDIFCYSSIASGLCKLCRTEEAKMFLSTMVEKGMAHNFVTYTTLIDIHCKEGDFVEANRMLQEMEKRGEKPSVVTYNAIIDGYCKHQNMKEAHRLRVEMGLKGIEPDSYTYTTLIHGECMSKNLDEAVNLFGEMAARGLNRNIVTYSALVSGLSAIGRTEEAFELYDEMMKMGFKPDAKVYASLVNVLQVDKS